MTTQNQNPTPVSRKLVSLSHLCTVGRQRVDVDDALGSSALLVGRREEVSHHRVRFNAVDEDRHREQAVLLHYPLNAGITDVMRQG